MFRAVFLLIYIATGQSAGVYMFKGEPETLEQCEKRVADFLPKLVEHLAADSQLGVKVKDSRCVEVNPEEEI